MPIQQLFPTSSNQSGVNADDGTDWSATTEGSVVAADFTDTPSSWGFTSGSTLNALDIYLVDARYTGGGNNSYEVTLRNNTSGTIIGTASIAQSITTTATTYTISDVAWDSITEQDLIDGLEVTVVCAQSGMPSSATWLLDAIRIDIDYTAADPNQSRELGQLIATEAVQALNVIQDQSVELGLVAATETLQAITVATAITVQLGQVIETETLQLLTVVEGELIEPIGFIPETELPQPFTVIPGEITEPIGLLSSTETLLALTPSQTVPAQNIEIGLITESETLFTLSSIVDSVVPTALTTDTETTFSLTPLADQILAILQATETETIQPIAVSTPVTGSAFYTILRLPTISGTHTDFPVQIVEQMLPPTMVDGGANSIANGGGDLVAYSDIARTNQIPLEVVECVTGATPAVELWVKLPSASTGAIIVLEKSLTQTSQPAVTSTYGRNAVWSDYRQVYHMGSTLDSTGNGWDLTWLGASPTVNNARVPNLTPSNNFSGASGDCATFPADTDPASARIFRNNLNDYEVSMWIRPESISTTQGLFAPRDDGDVTLIINATGQLVWNSYASASNEVIDPTSLSLNTDYLVTVSVDIDGNMSLHKDGVSVGTPIATVVPDPDLGTDCLIGALYDPSGINYNGVMGEFRVRNSLTSQDWKAAENTLGREGFFSMYGDGWHNDVGSIASPIEVGFNKTFDTVQRVMTALDRIGTLTENVEVRLTDNAEYDPEWSRTFLTPNLNYNSFSIEVKGFGAGVHGGVWGKGAKIARSEDSVLILPNSQLDFTDLTVWQQNEFGGDVTSGNSCRWLRCIGRHNGGGSVFSVFNGGEVIDSVATVGSTASGVPLNIGIDVAPGIFRNVTCIGGIYGVQTNGNVAHQMRNIVCYGYGTASTNFPNGSTNMDIDNCASADSGFGGTNEVTLSATDPFYDSANFDYHPNILGELYGQGTATGQSATDLAGQSWKTPPSIGALETNQEIAVITQNTTAQNATPTVNGGVPYTGVETQNIFDGNPDSANNDGNFINVYQNSNPVEHRNMVRVTGLSNFDPNDTIVSAQLHLSRVFSSTGNRVVDARRILRDWVQGTGALGSTWNEWDAPGDGAWTTAGVNGDGTDRVATPTDSQTHTDGGTWQPAFDLTADVQDIVDGTIATNNGWLLSTDNVGGADTFATYTSPINGTTATPEMVVAYIPAPAGITSGTYDIGFSGDYLTVSDWIADINAGGTATGNITGRLIDDRNYGAIGNQDIAFTGFNKAGFTVLLTVEESVRHNGTFGTGARFEGFADFGTALSPFGFDVEWLSVYNTATANGSSGLGGFDSGQYGCIARTDASDTGSYALLVSANKTCESCLAVGGETVFSVFGSGDSSIYNATAVNGVNGFSADNLTNPSFGNLRNCVAYNNSGLDFSGTATGTVSHNASEDGTHPGTNGVTISGNPFVDSASLDFTPTDGGQLDGTGTATNQPALDVEGNAWVTADIGALIAQITGGAGNQTISTGLLTETETVQPLTVLADQIITTGLLAETELVQPISADNNIIQVIGLLSEAETLFNLTVTAGAISAETGLSIDTEALFSLTPAFGAISTEIGLSIDTEAVQALTATFGGVTVETGLITDTETVFSLTSIVDQVTSIGQVTETEALFALDSTVHQVIALNQAVETELLFVISSDGSIVEPIGLLTETETPLTITMVPGAISEAIGFATDTEATQALAFSTSVSVELGLVTDTELAQTITADTPSATELGLLTETESLFALTSDTAVTLTLGLVTEVENILPFVADGSTVQLLGQATETDAVFGLTLIQEQFVSVGLVSETETVFNISGILDQAVAINQVLDTESVNALISDVGQVILVGFVTENESLSAITVVTAGSTIVDQVEDTESVFPLSIIDDQFIEVGLATETELIPSLGSISDQFLSLGLLSETEIVQPVAVSAPSFVELGLITENDSVLTIAVIDIAYGGVHNAAEWFPPASNVTILITDPRTDGVINTTNNACVESDNNPGMYIWDTSKLVTQPNGYQEYIYSMTDGITVKGGKIVVGGLGEEAIQTIIEGVWSSDSRTLTQGTTAIGETDIANIVSGVWSNTTRTITGSVVLSPSYETTLLTNLWSNPTRTLTDDVNLSPASLLEVETAIWNSASRELTGPVLLSATALTDLATSVWSNVSRTLTESGLSLDESAMVRELWQIGGLDPNNPVTNTQTETTSGNVNIQYTGNSSTAVTATRQP